LSYIDALKWIGFILLLFSFLFYSNNKGILTLGEDTEFENKKKQEKEKNRKKKKDEGSVKNPWNKVNNWNKERIDYPSMEEEAQALRRRAGNDLSFERRTVRSPKLTPKMSKNSTLNTNKNSTFSSQRSDSYSSYSSEDEDMSVGDEADIGSEGISD